MAHEGNLILDVAIKDGEEKSFVKSERLKFTKTFKGAKNWRDRFYSIPLEAQLERIGNKWFKQIDRKDLVAVSLQYYRVTMKGELIFSSYDNEALAKYRNDDKYEVTKSVTRQALVERKDYQEWKDAGRFEEVATKAGGPKKGERYLNSSFYRDKR